MKPTDVDRFAEILSARIEKETFARKYAPAKEVLKLIGAGAFLAASLSVNLPEVLKPFQKQKREYEAWKRFNIPYLKRTIERLEKQRLVEIAEERQMQVVRLTKKGKEKIRTLALEAFCPQKPNRWDHHFTLVCFDLPESYAKKRKALVSYLRAWHFYPLQKSVYIHAYPCRDEMNTLRADLGINEYVRIFTVTQVEQEQALLMFFGI